MSDRPTFGGGVFVPVKPVEFDLQVLRGNKQETHTFRALPRVDAGSVASLASIVRGEDASGYEIVEIIRTISKMMDDTDGTPAEWSPTVWETPESPADTDPGDDPGLHAVDDTDSDGSGDDDAETLYEGPDGQPHTAAEIRDYLDRTNWSSRRRWLYLMHQDDDAVVESVALGKLYRWLIGKADTGGRPTRPSASSRR